MSDSTLTPPPPAPAPAPEPAASSTVRSPLPIVAISLAALALILAFAAAGVAWLPAVAAIVVAIIALVKKAQPRLLSILAIIIAPLAWLIAIIVAIVSIASGVGAALQDADDERPAVEQSAPADDAAPEDDGIASLGETVTNADGVSVTFQAITCGIASAGPQYFEETAKGQFCEVTYRVDNGSDEKIDLFASDITGEIGSATYESNTTISTFGGEMFTTALNPGLGADAVVYIDIPAGAVLDFVVYDPMWNFFTSELRVSAS